jgi:hypothetical protein
MPRTFSFRGFEAGKNPRTFAKSASSTALFFAWRKCPIGGPSTRSTDAGGSILKSRAHEYFFPIATQTRQILHFFFSREKYPAIGSRFERSEGGRRSPCRAPPAEKYFLKMVDIVKTRD